MEYSLGRLQLVRQELANTLNAVERASLEAEIAAKVDQAINKLQRADALLNRAGSMAGDVRMWADIAKGTGLVFGAIELAAARRRPIAAMRSPRRRCRLQLGH